MRPLMIFAAGLGTRMRPLTDRLPKPLIHVGGRTLLDRALDLGRDAGAGPVVVNTHYLGDQIAAHLAGQDVAISNEAGAILDTGGGLRQALPLIPLDRAAARQGTGDFAMDAAGRISRRGDFVYGGAQIIRPDRLADIPDRVFSLNRLWDLLIADGRAHGIVHRGGWCDVGYPQAIPLAEQVLHG